MNFNELALLIQITCYILIFSCVTFVLEKIPFYKIVRGLWRKLFRRKNKIGILEILIEDQQRELTILKNRLEHYVDYFSDSNKNLVHYINERIAESKAKPKPRKR